MTPTTFRTVVASITGVLCLAASCLAGPSRAKLADDAALRRLLIRPAEAPSRLPKGWRSAHQPDIHLPALSGGGEGGDWHYPLSKYGMVRASAIVVVGEVAGSDHSVYAPPGRMQITTFYLKVIGYVKDTTGRRASYLKIVAPCGFLDGGQTNPFAPLPYLETGKRYVLYLVPNTGFLWGVHGIANRDHHPIGHGDEYWAVANGRGRFFEADNGQLVGPGLIGDDDPFATNRPFGIAVRQIFEAAERERRGEPAPPDMRPDAYPGSPEQ